MRIVYKLLTFLGIFTLGAISPWLWSVVFTNDAAFPFKIQFVVDPVDRLLLPHEERVEILPHMVIPYSLRYEAQNSAEWQEFSRYRSIASSVAIQEYFGVDAVAGPYEWQFVNCSASSARDELTQLQIKEIKPGFLPHYLAMRDALFELDALLSEMYFANGAMSASAGYSYTAYPTELLARLAHYQMAKGGVGGAIEFDLQAFDRSIILKSRSLTEGPHRDAYPGHRKRLMEIAARISKLLDNWDPVCSRLIVAHVILKTEDFQPLPR